MVGNATLSFGKAHQEFQFSASLGRLYYYVAVGARQAFKFATCCKERLSQDISPSRKESR